MPRHKIILLLALLLLAAGGLFWAMAATFKRELRQVFFTQMQQHAIKTAEDISRGRAEAGLIELVHAQQTVKAAMIVDPKGRLFLLRLDPDAGLGSFVPDPDAVHGYPAKDIIEAIEANHPNLENKSFYLVNERTRETLGSLFVIYDATPPADIVWRAALYTAGQLLMILGVLGAVGWVAAVQQRTTRRLRQQRDRSEHLAYVGTLAAGLAHEIRNPLNALAMQLEMLEEDVQKTSSAGGAGRIQRIRNGLLGVERTVSEFLNYAAPGQQKPALVDLETQLTTICREFTADQPQSEGLVEYSVAPGLRAWCDINALRQVLGNLLSNGWRMQEPGRRRLRVEASREGEWIAIAVEDAGPGVPDDQRDRVFECFFSTRSDGTGLGLPIAQRLVEMNDGSLELSDQRSSLGGARFVLRLPARQPTGRRR